MITAVGLCPWPPVLVRELTGTDPVLPELRHACAKLVDALISTAPEVIFVVGPGPGTRTWAADSHLDLSLFAPLRRTSASSLPTPLGIGSYLLDQAQYEGRRVLQAVSTLASVGTCAGLGHRLATASDRIALLAMGDGSARRSLKAPGYLDTRARPFDATVVEALESADFRALERVSADLARDLMASGRIAWQTIAGALRSVPATVEVLYKDDPFGVLYFAGLYRPAGAVGPEA